MFSQRRPFSLFLLARLTFLHHHSLVTRLDHDSILFDNLEENFTAHRSGFLLLALVSETLTFTQMVSVKKYWHLNHEYLGLLLSSQTIPLQLS